MGRKEEDAISWIWESWKGGRLASGVVDES